MWTIEQLEAKVKEMAGQIEQSAAQHHILVGSKLAFESMLSEAKKIGDVVAIVDPALAPDVVATENIETAVEAVVEMVN